MCKGFEGLQKIDRYLMFFFIYLSKATTERRSFK